MKLYVNYKYNIELCNSSICIFYKFFIIPFQWNVLGESRMGFFSKVPIAKGEEITFDYSFERFG